jgi:hypothetical protein
VQKVKENLCQEMASKIQGTELDIKTKALVKSTWQELKTRVVYVDAQARCGGCRNRVTSADRVKLQ